MTSERTEVTPDAAAEETRRLFEAGRLQEAMDQFLSLHPADQAELLSELEPEQRAPLLPRIDRERLAEIVGYLEDEARLAIVGELEPAVLGPLLDEADRDVAVDVLHGLPPERAQRTLAAMRTAAEVELLLPHPDETAGGRMTTDFVALQKEWTVDQVLSYLRRIRPAAEESYYLYAVDDQQRLEGVVSLRHLIIAAPERRIAEIMTPEVVSVGAREDQEEVARQIAHYNFVALPVVDEERHLVGVISVDSAMDVAEEEATEDMFLMAGLVESESLLRPAVRSVAPRLSWLLINLLTAIAAAGMVNIFRDTIAKAAVLAVFMPVIAGMGGNAGIQTITLVVRSIALGEVELSDVRRVLQRELLIGITNGVVIGVLLGVLASIWGNSIGLGIVAGSAMLLNMTTAVAVGVLVPLTLRALKLDPALAAGVIVTTFTDVLGFFFFLGLATLMIDQIA